MRSQCKPIFKRFFYEHLIQTRADLHLSQKKMADLLLMDLRSYCDLDHGYNGCSGLTLALFLIECCPNPLAFLSDLRVSLQSGIQPLATNTHKDANTALSYRLPLPVVNVKRDSLGTRHPICPRCGKLLDHRDMSFCDHCGQKLDWYSFSGFITRN